MAYYFFWLFNNQYVILYYPKKYKLYLIKPLRRNALITLNI